MCCLLGDVVGLIAHGPVVLFVAMVKGIMVMRVMSGDALDVLA